MLPTSILGFIDSSVVNVALPKVKSELGVGFEASQWVANAYLLTLAGLILFGGSVGDTFGQRRTFILALSGFAAASIVRGLAPTAGALVVLRGVPGAAAAFLIPASLALVGAAFSGEDRGRAVGTWAAARALTTALDPPLGVVGRCRRMAIRLFPERVDRRRSRTSDTRPAKSAGPRRQPRFLEANLGRAVPRFDELGLIEAGTRASLRGAAFVLLALPLGALLVWRETRARHPVVPPRLFRDWRFVAANAMTVVMYASLTGSLFLLPFLLIYTYGYSAAAAGAAFLPFSAIMAVGSRTAGGLALRIGSRAAWRPRRCRRARIRVREHVGVSPRVGCGCRGVPARDVDGGGARRGRRVNGNCVLGDDPSEHRGRI